MIKTATSGTLLRYHLHATFGDSDKCLDLHSYISSKLIAISIEKEIALRGATSYGKFDYNAEKKILIGPAVDEAATWHDKSNWIGLILTPSAYFQCNDSDYDYPFIEYEEVPIKNHGKYNTKCANWVKYWIEKYNKKDLIEKFKNIAPEPVTIDIGCKLNYTIKYFDFVNKEKGD